MKSKTKEAYALLKKATREFSKAHSTKADFVRNCSDETGQWVNRCIASCPQDASHEKCGEICIRKSKCFYNECCSDSPDCKPIKSYWDSEYCPFTRGPSPSDPSRGHSTLKDALSKRKNSKAEKIAPPTLENKDILGTSSDGKCLNQDGTIKTCQEQRRWWPQDQTFDRGFIRLMHAVFNAYPTHPCTVQMFDYTGTGEVSWGDISYAMEQWGKPLWLACSPS